MAAGIIFALLSAMCIVYYFLIVSYAGIGTSFAPAWLVAFVIFAVISIFSFLHFKKVVNIPVLIRRGVIVFVILCFGLLFTIEGFIISGMTAKPDPNLDYIIVMGAQVRGNAPSKSLLRRIEAATDYLMENPDTVAVVSGGQGDGENLTEAQCMYNYLVLYGISPERIIMEDKATNTEENIVFSMAIINELSQDECTIGIVTNDFHVFRTVQVCKSKGYNVSGLPAKSDEILFINYMIREAFAVFQYKLWGYI